MSLPDISGYQTAILEAGVRIDPRLELCFTLDKGYHIKAAADISAGTLLAASPLRICIDLSPSSPAAAPLADLGLPPLCTSALLLQRALNQDGSPLPRAHIALLKALRTPLNVLVFGPEHLRVLRSTTLHGSSMHLEERYAELVAPFLRTAAGLRFGGAELQSEGCEGFMRAAALVMSRCFHADGSENASTPSALVGVLGAAEKAAGASGDARACEEPLKSHSLTGPILAPFLDLFNHHTHLASTHNARVADEFHFYALRPLLKGEEVFLSYGQLGDGQLLHTYGFLPEDSESGNPHNSVHLTSSSVVSAVREALRAAGDFGTAQAKVFNAAAALLRKANLLDSEVFVLSNCCDVDASADPWRFLMACLPQSLLTCLQVLLLDAPALVEYKIAAAGEPLILPPPQAPRSARATGESQQGSNSSSDSRSGTDSDDDAKTDSSDDDNGDDAPTWVALIAVLRHKAASYESTFSEDKAWFAAQDSSPVESLAESRQSREKRMRTLDGVVTAESTSSSLLNEGEESAVGLEPVIRSLNAGGGAVPVPDSVSDSGTLGLLRSCRLLAMREKELLHRLLTAAEKVLEAVQGQS